ncbi:TPA: hypothetical protein ACH3X1_003501 [Trebouxia sp. C0004]
MAAITVQREGTGNVISFDTVAEVGSAAEFISSIEKVWGEGLLLKPSSTSAFTARTPEPFPHGIYTFLPKSGKVLHDADLVRRVDEAEARIAEQRIHQDDAEARIAELSIQQNRGSQTTQTAQKLGAVWMKRAHKVMQLSCLLPMAEGASIVKTACAAVLGRFQTAPYTIPDLTGRVFAKKRKRGETADSDVYAPNHLSGLTLADLIPMSMEVGFKEQEHMQPVLISLIQAAMDAVQCDCYLIDTHSSNQLDDPISRPDCTLIAAGQMAMWTQVVSVWEFKLGNSKTETETMFGQQVERCRYVLDAYDRRQFAVAVNFTMNSLEVMTVERQAYEDFKLSTTGPQPFSISTNSPGFRLLVNLLSTAKTDLGFVTSDLPDISQVEDHQFKVQLLQKKGTAHLGSGSWVFSVLLESGMDAILKLNNSPNEVVFDVAGGIANAAKRDIAHRDITPNNFGQREGRGYLYDFSAAKVSGTATMAFVDMAGHWKRPRSASSLTGITGTVLWAALSVLEGEQHSLSSMLEGLFISVLSISCNGKLHLRHAMKPDQLALCANLRRGHLTSPKLAELPNVATHLQPLIIGLHNLFYPLNRPTDSFRGYNTEVTVESVQGVCRQVCSNLSE